jgi:hypothetical protein
MPTTTACPHALCSDRKVVNDVRPVEVMGGGAFDDQEGGVVVEWPAGVSEQVAMDLVQQGVGPGGAQVGDPFGEGLRKAVHHRTTSTHAHLLSAM